MVIIFLCLRSSYFWKEHFFLEWLYVGMRENSSIHTSAHRTAHAYQESEIIFDPVCMKYCEMYKVHSFTWFFRFVSIEYTIIGILTIESYYSNNKMLICLLCYDICLNFWGNVHCTDFLSALIMDSDIWQSKLLDIRVL